MECYRLDDYFPQLLLLSLHLLYKAYITRGSNDLHRTGSSVVAGGAPDVSNISALRNMSKKVFIKNFGWPMAAL